MSEEIDRIYRRLTELEQEVSNLREGYVIVNKRYNEALSSREKLTADSLKAADRKMMVTAQ